MQTPWGPSQTVIHHEHGILRVTTARHGGFYVPDAVIKRIPAWQREEAKRWSGSENWYEEDCQWYSVALEFPELFRPDMLALAHQEHARQSARRRERLERERDIFEQCNAIDAGGMCYSDADPGL